MKSTIRIKGEVFSGRNRGREFLVIDWVKEGIERLLGFRPYPGTLNVKIPREASLFFAELQGGAKVLNSPLPQFCNACLLDISVGGIRAAAVFPEEKVWVHQDTLEIVAPVRIRDVLDLKDSDQVEVEATRHFQPSAVLFDLDGTLIDSIPFFYRMAERYLKPWGISPQLHQLREAMNWGKDPWDCLLPRQINGRDEIIQTLKKQDRIEFGKFYEKGCRPFPRAKETLEAIKAKGLKTGIITTNWDVDAVKNLLLRFHIAPEDYVGLISAARPAPGKMESIKVSILECLHGLGIPPSECVYVGDAVINMLAGKSLFISTIGVLTGVATKEELLTNNADAVIGDISEVLNLIET